MAPMNGARPNVVGCVRYHGHDSQCNSLYISVRMRSCQPQTQLIMVTIYFNGNHTAGTFERTL